MQLICSHSVVAMPARNKKPEAVIEACMDKEKNKTSHGRTGPRLELEITIESLSFEIELIYILCNVLFGDIAISLF